MGFQVKYKTFEQIEEEKEWWRLPFVSEFLRKNGLDSALKTFVGTDTVQARQFVKYAFGQLKSFNDAYLTKDWLSNSDKNDSVAIEKSTEVTDNAEGPSNSTTHSDGKNLEELHTDNDELGNGHSAEVVPQVGETTESDKHFWKDFANVMNQSIVRKLGLPTPEKLKWDGFDLLNKIGLQSKSIAEAGYIESGLATLEGVDEAGDRTSGSTEINTVHSSFPDIRKATEDLLKQTDSVLGTLMVLTAAISESKKKARLSGESSKQEGSYTEGGVLNEKLASRDGPVLDEKKAQEMKELFATAESAMEAWAMLATSLGQPSFIKSEFEKICFLDNETTDTQVSFFALQGAFFLG